MLVRKPDAGVPSAGVTSVGEVDRTTEPVPVSVRHPIRVVAGLAITHGAVAPMIVVVPGVIEDAAAVTACHVACVPSVATRA
jgi:hypothetical protein